MEAHNFDGNVVEHEFIELFSRPGAMLEVVCVSNPETFLNSIKGEWMVFVTLNNGERYQLCKTRKRNEGRTFKTDIGLCAFQFRIGAQTLVVPAVAGERIVGIRNRHDR